MYANWIESDKSFSFSTSDNGGVEIEDKFYMQLLIQNSKGLGIIGRDSEGLPVLTAIDPPTSADLAELERRWRDAELASAAGLRDRHRDQIEITVDTAISDVQFREILFYIQALRDWPQSDRFPNSTNRPIAPQWYSQA